MKFKAGQKIECVDAGSNTYITNGNTYDVIKTEEGLAWVVIKADDGKERSYSANRFKLVKEPALKFKAGNRVRCIDASSHTLIKEGDEYTVTASFVDCGDNFVQLDAISGMWLEDRFELVVEKLEAVEAGQTVVLVAAEPAPEKLVLTLKVGSVGIDLDPTNPKSRMFAEAFIRTVYEEIV